jgi:ABC-type transport system substrate-binding protein
MTASSPVRRRIIGYQNPDVARLLAAARAAVDLDERDRFYRQVAPLIQADVPVTFLFPAVQTYVVPREIEGLIEPYRAGPVQFLEHLRWEGR